MGLDKLPELLLIMVFFHLVIKPSINAFTHYCNLEGSSWKRKFNTLIQYFSVIWVSQIPNVSLCRDDFIKKARRFTNIVDIKMYMHVTTIGIKQEYQPLLHSQSTSMLYSDSLVWAVSDRRIGVFGLWPHVHPHWSASDREWNWHLLVSFGGLIRLFKPFLVLVIFCSSYWVCSVELFPM